MYNTYNKNKINIPNYKFNNFGGGNNNNNKYLIIIISLFYIYKKIK